MFHFFVAPVDTSVTKDDEEENDKEYHFMDDVEEFACEEEEYKLNKKTAVSSKCCFLE